MKVPVIGIMSSDCDIKSVTKPVIINDALTTSVDLVLGELVDAYLEGKKAYVPAPVRRTPHGDRGGDRRPAYTNNRR